ncbi:MAG: type IV pilus modification protein PilV [Casimicrobiaceae bacterium]|nr:type IV pilus modification protein PilV [Casimicrobiaceae bacterium]MCX8098002.1 type IV pilus modification protein PilV [Casimicrobiaceae bacterium]MDW8311703.1 type IV pilus modification protein PilV [Burkholderiales bacterium]
MRASSAFTGSSQGGFSLLEALIAIVIISLGVLGIAGLQLSALRDTQTSRNVTAATILARDMADRLRTSAVAVKNFDFNMVPSSVNNCVGPTSSCTEITFFASDYAAWRALVANRLPSGEGRVCRDATPDDGTPAAPACTGGNNDPLVVKVWWWEKGNQTSTQERFVMPMFARDGVL